MTKSIVAALIIATGITYSPLAMADSKNWSSEKAADVQRNRDSNAGAGNGSEPNTPSKPGEKSVDQDPGKSGQNNKSPEAKQ